MRVLATFTGERYLFPCVALILLFHNVQCVSAQDVSVAGTPQQMNERIQQLGEASKSAPHEYTIGNGDLLSISVFDVPELTRDVRVSQSGTIGLPLVPTRLHVSGLTEMQANQMIADVLRANGLVSHPEVEVMVKEHKSRPITIVGAVQHPMVYEADSSVTVLEALAEAGGISNDAGDTIIITRSRAATFTLVPNPEPISSSAPGSGLSAEEAGQPAPTNVEKSGSATTSPPALPPVSETGQPLSPAADSSNTSNAGTEAAVPTGNIITINLSELLEKGDTRNNILLQGGDVVTVPHAGIVYVLGAVGRPGGFVMSNDRAQLTTLKVLSLAGGVTKIAKLDHAVIIRTDRQGKQTETEVDLKKVMNRQAEDLQVRASDILYVPESRGKEVMYQAIQIMVAVGTGVALYRLAYH